MTKRTKFVWLLSACALTIRFALVVWAGNAPETKLTGGSDTIAYQTLGDNIVHHRGFTYAGEPTALRPPLYPLFLAFVQLVAGKDYRFVARMIQLMAGILLAVVCAIASKKLGGSPGIAFAAALAAPTLVFFSAELLSETFAALIVAAFFLVVVTDSSPMWAGAFIGLGMLERFNLATLAVAYLVYQFVAKRPVEAVKHVALAGLIALTLVSPWIARNIVVFSGQVYYSTHTGTNLLQGLVTPDGRPQRGELAKIRAAAGWTILDIETNSPERNDFPPEPQLDRMAMNGAIAQLGHVDLFALATRKLGYFWLSFEQLFDVQRLSRTKFLIRLPGIAIYWFLLGLGIVGWQKLRLRDPDAALLFATYPVVITAMHLPFVMNTRIRSPLIEPALVILAGLAFAMVAEREPDHEKWQTASKASAKGKIGISQE